MSIPTVYDCKIISSKGNELYPLPKDYHSLTKEGQKFARINACCQQQSPESFVYAWEFLRRTYLFPLPAGTLYGDDLTESPPFHYDIVHSVAAYPRNIWACPRGSAKSTLTDEMLLLLSLTRPGFPSALVLATNDLVEARMATLMWVLTSGEEIYNDFGALKPKKGGSGSIWNLHHLKLTNQSHIHATSTESRKRGMKPRPKFIALDDPEYDTKATTDVRTLRRMFEVQLFRVLLPMGQKDVRMLWTGTMISKQTSLFSACQGTDPRFRTWQRQILAGIYKDELGVEKSIWSDHMDLEYLEGRKEELGAGAFAAEYLNKPGSGEHATFIIDPDLCQYWEEGPFGKTPYGGDSVIHYKNKVKGSDEFVDHAVPSDEFMKDMVVLGLFDYAPTIGPNSDYSALVFLGFQKKTDLLFILDAWVGKLKDDKLMLKILEMGMKWRPRVMGIEAVSVQKRFYELVASFIEEKAIDGNPWRPTMYPIRNYSGSRSKQDRIGGMQWRFNTFKIKYPATRKQDKGIGELYYQTEEFNSDAIDGNLQHDDVLDAMAMVQEINRSHSSRQQEVPFEETSIVQKIIDGQHLDSVTGLPLHLGINLSELNQEDLAKMMDACYNEAENKKALSLGSRLDATNSYTR